MQVIIGEIEGQERLMPMNAECYMHAFVIQVVHLDSGKNGVTVNKYCSASFHFQEAGLLCEDNLSCPVFGLIPDDIPAN